MTESSALRVVHVISTPTGTGGAEQTLSQLVSFGDQQGWEQLVLNPFALDPVDSDVRRMCSAARYEGFRCRSWKGLPRLRMWLAGQLAVFRPEIVHAHLFHASALIATLRRPPAARLILSHHHGDHFLATGRLGHELVDRLVGRRFDQVVACSQAMEDYLLYRHHYATSRVSHVYNGWRGDPLPRATPSSRNVICVARLCPQKNHRLLLEAIAYVRARVPDVRLQIVGDGECAAALRAYTRELGLQESVEFLGTTDDVWPLLAGARVFALTSLYEPLGIAALEAMAAGLPVIAAAVGGLREIVDPGVTGFLVAPLDTRELALRLEQLLVDDELAASMGVRARDRALRFHANRTARGYAQIYEQLLASPRPIAHGEAR